MQTFAICPGIFTLKQLDAVFQCSIPSHCISCYNENLIDSYRLCATFLEKVHTLTSNSAGFTN